MSLVGNRRRKKSREYKILIVPEGDGGVTKSVKAGTWGFALGGSALGVVFFLFVFLAFRYTPLGHFVNAGNAGVVDSVGSETDRRIRALAEEVAVLKSYNAQLRKALGEHSAEGISKEDSDTHASEPPKVDAVKEEPIQDLEISGEEFNPAHATTVQNTRNYEELQTSFPLFTPVDGVITQGFEPGRKHYGLDFAASEGTTVHAAAQGYVVFAGWTYEYGYTLILAHANGFMTVYKHNSSLLKSTGSVVRRGELIGLVGSTGKTSTGPHLHFEVLKDGIPQDPQLSLLKSRIGIAGY